MKGSWNRSIPTGYKVVRVKFTNGQPIGWYENFMTGFWVEGDERALVWGRPADVALAPVCSHCGCKIIGHGAEAEGEMYCCAHCASQHGVQAVQDRA